MSSSDQVRARIEEIIGSDRVVLFMKGTPRQPQCGFSAATVSILDSVLPSYTTFNVLEDQTVREGIKAFSDWPTIPQLYIDKEFMGGCDIVKQMFNTGELHDVLGLAQPDKTPPEIHISAAAAEMIKGVLENNPGAQVHLSIDGRWQHNFQLGAAEGHEVVAESNGIQVLMDLVTAPRARGLRLDVEESFQGKQLQVENPNAPPPVKELSAPELKQKLDAGEALYLIDVRDTDERAKADIPGSIMLDESSMRQIESLPKDTALVFMCHVGQRSAQAAEHFRVHGYTNVHNLSGGIEAWSQQVDASVPRY
ncbi:MAG: Grx4 family monothiol glutaredoxin [Gammaproteobacteria bacterium]|nr:Grx4 family monothiol glutaredoxin [Gammaproteobacteria bacterium]